MALRLLNANETFVVRDDELAGVVDGDPEVSYTIRQISYSVAEDIAKAHTTKKFDQESRRLVEVTDTKAAGLNVLDRVLVSWTGVNIGDQPAPCEMPYKLEIGRQRMDALVALALMPRRDEVARSASFCSPA